MQQQFAAFASTCNTTYQPATPAPPPMQQYIIPNFGTFQPAGLESVDGEEDVEAASMLTRDTNGVHHLLISLGAVARVAYSP